MSWGEEYGQSGGGGGNSFATIDCPAGTDPVADSTTDTLQLLASGAMEITGDAGADSVTLKADVHRAVTVQNITAASQAITATDGAPYRPVSLNAAYTLTSQPTIAAGREGQLIKIKNVGSYNLILQDVNALGGSLLRLTANTLTIQPGGTMSLVYDSTIGFWIEQYLLNPQTFTPSVATFTSDLSTPREIAAASTLDTAPNFTISYIGTPSAAQIDVSAGGDPSTLWPIDVPSPYTALNGGTTPPTQQFYRGTTIGGTRIFTVTATVAGVPGLTKTLTFTYYNNRFAGNNAKTESEALTEGEIEALATVQVSNATAGSFSLAGGGNRLWYAYPSRLGTGIYAAINAEVANFVNRGTSITVTNPSGYAETYQQWCTSVVVSGTVTLVADVALANNRIYMGPATDVDPISNASILALDDTADGESIVSNTVTRTYTAIKIEAGEYLWFVHPDRVADLFTIKDQTGFGVAGSYRTNVTHTNQWGYQETYRCWRSDNTGIYPSGQNITVVSTAD